MNDIILNENRQNKTPSPTSSQTSSTSSSSSSQSCLLANKTTTTSSFAIKQDSTDKGPETKNDQDDQMHEDIIDGFSFLSFDNEKDLINEYEKKRKEFFDLLNQANSNSTVANSSNKSSKYSSTSATSVVSSTASSTNEIVQRQKSSSTASSISSSSSSSCPSVSKTSSKESSSLKTTKTKLKKKTKSSNDSNLVDEELPDDEQSKQQTLTISSSDVEATKSSDTTETTALSKEESSFVAKQEDTEKENISEDGSIENEPNKPISEGINEKLKTEKEEINSLNDKKTTKADHNEKTEIECKSKKQKHLESTSSTKTESEIKKDFVAETEAAVHKASLATLKNYNMAALLDTYSNSSSSTQSTINSPNTPKFPLFFPQNSSNIQTAPFSTSLSPLPPFPSPSPLSTSSTPNISSLNNAKQTNNNKYLPVMPPPIIPPINSQHPISGLPFMPPYPPNQDHVSLINKWMEYYQYNNILTNPTATNKNSHNQNQESSIVNCNSIKNSSPSTNNQSKSSINQQPPHSPSYSVANTKNDSNNNFNYKSGVNANLESDILKYQNYSPKKSSIAPINNINSNNNINIVSPTSLTPSKPSSSTSSNHNPSLKQYHSENSFTSSNIEHRNNISTPKENFYNTQQHAYPKFTSNDKQSSNINTNNQHSQLIANQNNLVNKQNSSLTGISSKTSNLLGTNNFNDTNTYNATNNSTIIKNDSKQNSSFQEDVKISNNFPKSDTSINVNDIKPATLSPFNIFHHSISPHAYNYVNESITSPLKQNKTEPIQSYDNQQHSNSNNTTKNSANKNKFQTLEMFTNNQQHNRSIPLPLPNADFNPSRLYANHTPNLGSHVGNFASSQIPIDPMMNNILNNDMIRRDLDSKFFQSSLLPQNQHSNSDKFATNFDQHQIFINQMLRNNLSNLAPTQSPIFNMPPGSTATTQSPSSKSNTGLTSPTHSKSKQSNSQLNMDMFSNPFSNSKANISSTQNVSNHLPLPVNKFITPSPPAIFQSHSLIQPQFSSSNENRNQNMNNIYSPHKSYQPSKSQISSSSSSSKHLNPSNRLTLPQIPKSEGKWCAIHVKIAHMIAMHKKSKAPSMTSPSSLSGHSQKQPVSRVVASNMAINQLNTQSKSSIPSPYLVPNSNLIASGNNFMNETNNNGKSGKLSSESNRNMTTTAIASTYFPPIQSSHLSPSSGQMGGPTSKQPNSQHSSSFAPNLISNNPNIANNLKKNTNQSNSNEENQKYQFSNYGINQNQDHSIFNNHLYGAHTNHSNFPNYAHHSISSNLPSQVQLYPHNKDSHQPSHMHMTQSNYSGNNKVQSKEMENLSINSNNNKKSHFNGSHSNTSSKANKTRSRSRSRSPLRSSSTAPRDVSSNSKEIQPQYLYTEAAITQAAQHHIFLEKYRQEFFRSMIGPTSPANLPPVPPHIGSTPLGFPSHLGIQHNLSAMGLNHLSNLPIPSKSNIPTTNPLAQPHLFNQKSADIASSLMVTPFNENVKSQNPMTNLSSPKSKATSQQSSIENPITHKQHASISPSPIDKGQNLLANHTYLQHFFEDVSKIKPSKSNNQPRSDLTNDNQNRKQTLDKNENFTSKMIKEPSTESLNQLNNNCANKHHNTNEDEKQVKKYKMSSSYENIPFASNDNNENGFINSKNSEDSYSNSKSNLEKSNDKEDKIINTSIQDKNHEKVIQIKTNSTNEISAKKNEVEDDSQHPMILLEENELSDNVPKDENTLNSTRIHAKSNNIVTAASE